MDTNCKSISRPMGEENEVYKYITKYYSPLKSEGNPVICINIIEHWRFLC
jgi:hypothetical protein